MRSKTPSLLAAALFALAFVPATAAAEKSAGSASAFCAQDAKTLKGEERERHIAECPKALGAQQNKMKTCNAEAGKRDLHGEERRTFMSTCLKG